MFSYTLCLEKLTLEDFVSEIISVNLSNLYPYFIKKYKKFKVRASKCLKLIKNSENSMGIHQSVI